MKLGLAGSLAKAFVQSKLTPLVIMASLLMGVFAVMKTPREEEPQIIVPMADVIVQMPGAPANEVEKRIAAPMEKLIWEVPGVEYLYSTSSPGRAMVVVRFKVGQDQERAFVRLREKLQSHFDAIPPGASQPIIKPRSIDDVPILALTLHSKTANTMQLRDLAARLEQAVKSVPDVSETVIIGGQPRQIKIDVDRAKLASRGIGFDQLLQGLSVANSRDQVGAIATGNSEIAINSGMLLRTARDVENTVIGGQMGPIRVGDVATVTDGGAEPTSYVTFGYGPGSGKAGAPMESAVTVSIAKRQGVNAVDVVHKVLAKVDGLKGTMIPGDVDVTVTRNYGETAAEKSNELLFHMGIAVVSVTILIGLTLGRRESLVVLTAIPVTLALTMLVFYLVGYTLNRITLFALIFSIGILVDDAIVVVENIVRHLRMPESKGKGVIPVTIRAVDEVGNPTILATFTVIAAILPMAFVGGLMGPYMRPIPVGASSAMLFSLLIAFIVTPWAGARLLAKSAEHGHHHDDENADDFLTRMYRRIMTPLLRSGGRRMAFFGMVGVLLLASMSLVAFKLVTVKMLPFDNKNEFQVIVDMPTGTSLEQTAVATRAIADELAKVPEVDNFQTTVGAASPYNFNGLVRHYFMRAASYQADIQVNLLGKHERSVQSHGIVKRIRPALQAVADRYGARIKVAEVPPGPPVLQTLVAEVYGPTPEARMDMASKVRDVFRKTEGVSDIDWYVDDDQKTIDVVPDQEKAALAGVPVSQINQTLRAALSGTSVGLLHDADAQEDVPILVRLPREGRNSLEAISNVSVRSVSGALVPLMEVVRLQQVATDKSVYHKNLLPVVYVTGEVVGKHESPVYAILQMNHALEQVKAMDGAKVEVVTTHVPEDTSRPIIKWDGEWHITYEVFRDLGIAFAAVLVIIYILVVAWFQDFKHPLVIMAPIPLTLVGILPGHAIMGAFFTATSMIGFIAGAGIIVRNSIILVDFIELRRREGYPLEQAVIDAGAVRFRPMLLTAAAVIVGSSVILFDPIFQGLAISLMAGEIASTLLSRFAVPVLYFMSVRKGAEAQPAQDISASNA